MSTSHAAHSGPNGGNSAPAPLWVRLLRRFPIPTWSGVAYLAVAVLVYLQSGREADHGARNLLVLLASGIIALHAASLIFGWLNTRGVVLRREIQGFGRVGSPFPIILVTRNTSRLFPKCLLRVREHEQGGLVVREPWACLAYIGAKRERRVQVRALLPHRGFFTFRRADVTSSAPFGLWRFIRHHSVESRVCVYPLALETPDWLESRLFQTTQNFGECLQASAGEDEVYGIREYRPGDNIRRIHWRTTARLGQPMLLEMEGRQDLLYRIILDTYAYEHDDERRPELERLISLAAGIVDSLHRRGMAIGLSHWSGSHESVEEDRGETVYHTMMEALALAGFASHPLEHWIGMATSHAPRGTRLVILSLGHPAQVREMLGGPVARNSIILSAKDIEVMALFANSSTLEPSARDSLALLLDD